MRFNNDNHPVKNKLVTNPNIDTFRVRFIIFNIKTKNFKKVFNNFLPTNFSTLNFIGIISKTSTSFIISNIVYFHLRFNVYCSYCYDQKFQQSSFRVF